MTNLPDEYEMKGNVPPISIYTIEGPLFFRAAQTFEQNILATIHYQPKVLILQMGKVPIIDATGEACF